MPANFSLFAECCSAGLGSLYGDHELQDENMDRQAELRIVEKCLWPHFERLQ
jgi:hypothetical protein